MMFPYPIGRINFSPTKKTRNKLRIKFKVDDNKQLSSYKFLASKYFKISKPTKEEMSTWIEEYLNFEFWEGKLHKRFLMLVQNSDGDEETIKETLNRLKNKRRL